KRFRILSLQKKNLVLLVQKIFLRTVGHHSNVDFNEINSANWESIGPPKSGVQWKNTIRQCGGDPTVSLSALDLRIHEMTPAEDDDAQRNFEDLIETDDVRYFDDEGMGHTESERTNHEMFGESLDFDNSTHIVVLQTPRDLEADEDTQMIGYQEESNATGIIHRPSPDTSFTHQLSANHPPPVRRVHYDYEVQYSNNCSNPGYEQNNFGKLPM
ncbi:hypothetical protein Bhyg_02853, partial [Pseudolycoriella hygida]